eukprot:scaffold83611_cov20-Tisochrysis_lutea.AAC.1
MHSQVEGNTCVMAALRNKRHGCKPTTGRTGGDVQQEARMPRTTEGAEALRNRKWRATGCTEALCNKMRATGSGVQQEAQKPCVSRLLWPLAVSALTHGPAKPSHTVPLSKHQNGRAQDLKLGRWIPPFCNVLDNTQGGVACLKRENNPLKQAHKQQWGGLRAFPASHAPLPMHSSAPHQRSPARPTKSQLFNATSLIPPNHTVHRTSAHLTKSQLFTAPVLIPLNNCCSPHQRSLRWPAQAPHLVPQAAVGCTTSIPTQPCRSWCTEATT